MVVVHCKLNFMKVVQNELLFWKLSMLYANLYCKSITWYILRFKTSLGLSGISKNSISHKQETISIVHVGCYLICPSLKEWQVSVGRMLKKYDHGTSKQDNDIVTAADFIGIPRSDKYNKSCSRTRHFWTNDRLFFFRKN